MKRMLQRIKGGLTDIYTGGAPDHADLEIARKVVMINIIFTIGFLFLIFFGALAHLHGNHLLGAFDHTTAIAVACAFVTLRIKKNFHFATYFSVCIMATLFTGLYVTGGIDNSGHVWSFTFPLFVMFMLGANKGSRLTLMYFLLLMVISCTAPGRHTYSFQFVLRFMGAFVAVTLLTYFFEYVREKTQDSISQKNNELEIALKKQRGSDEELKHKIGFEQLITTIATNFINRAPDEIHKGIELALQVMGEFVGVDRCYLLTFTNAHLRVDEVSEWDFVGTRPIMRSMKGVCLTEAYPWLARRILSREVVSFSDIVDIPSKAKQERDLLKRGNTKSMLTVPVGNDNSLRGYLGFESTRINKVWGKSDIILLKIAGEIFVNSLQRKNVEKKLQESEKFHRALIDILPDSFVITDLDGVLTFVSKTTLKMFGFETSEEVLGRNIIEFIEPADHAVARRWIYRMLRGEDSGVAEYGAVKVDGTSFYIASNGGVLRDTEGNAQGMIFVTRDITERKHAEEGIKASLYEKEVLLKEVHHRVKNNLAVIVSLLNLQARNIKDKQALEMFRDSQNRVKSLALIHEKLYKSRDLAKIDFAEYIRSTTTSLYKLYGTDPERVNLEIEVEDVCLDVERAVPCGLIINELVSNALKYAFPSQRQKKGRITVSLQANERNEIELTVKDDGVGMPEDFDVGKAESLGLNLVNILATDQLKGDVTLNRNGGTEFRVRFKG